MKSVLAALLMTGCSFSEPSDQFKCQIDSDCTSDRVCTQGYCVVPTINPIDAPPSDSVQTVDCTTFTSRTFDACSIPKPTADLALTMAGTYTYDTGIGSLLDPGGNATLPTSQLTANGRVLSVSSLTIASGTTLRVNGASNPLIIASWGTIDVSGIIDASSTLTDTGAGSNPAGCTAHVAQAGQDDAGGGGGGGGGGQAAGSKGGTGSSGSGGGGVGGAAIAVPTLLGGCSGAAGGTGSSAPGAGGAGGGAVQVTARVSITINETAKVHAGGAGGKAGLQDSTGGGGGGGGAGGMLGFESPMLTVKASAVLAANGGGGGQGAGNTNTPGVGEGGHPSSVRALGGTGGSGGQGGAGSGVGIVTGTGGANDGAGGGGGGGSAGFITFLSANRTVDAAAVISPAATILP